MPGIPSVYYGSEWGMPGMKENGSDNNLRPYINIENRSTYSTWLTGHISALAHIRQQEKALRFGSYKQIYLEYNRPFVFERSCEDENIYVAVNIADRNEIINLNECSNLHCGSGLWDLLCNEPVLDPGCIQIKPHSARILKYYEPFSAGDRCSASSSARLNCVS
jgi:glycosidase